jgi:hypothetical protein
VTRLRLLCTVGVLAACANGVPPKNVCEQARNLFQECGASVPLLEGESCAGVAKALARCVTDNAADCDQLAHLSSHLDGCRPDGGEDDFLPPAEDLPFPFEPRDAGRADAGH